MLRNREFRHFAVLFLFMAGASLALGFMINLKAGLLCLFCAAAYGAAFTIYTRARYESIAKLSEQIDLVLHNEDRLNFDVLEEGELSILHSEITKMILRIRQQNNTLKKEKLHLSDSLADIAHQLRTPLTSANLILSFIEDTPDENKRRVFVRETEELLLQMDWLITTLLKLSRLDAGVVEFQNEPADIGGLIRTALRPLLIPMELRNIDLQIDAAENLTIRCDPRWFPEALQNILKNCMESAGENGKIEITCTDNVIFTEICIHDSGPGFAEQDLSRLFDRFYRGKSTNTAGFGIGLALCRMVITQQGGTISAKNHARGGAVFSIRFPK